jgi:hypothetical protein
MHRIVSLFGVMTLKMPKDYWLNMFKKGKHHG